VRHRQAPAAQTDGYLALPVERTGLPDGGPPRVDYQRIAVNAGRRPRAGQPGAVGPRDALATLLAQHHADRLGCEAAQISEP
jgi:hypothetical protein